ncbi:MAG: hypothetical protein AAGK37_19985 [Pseudomonadota bacterium]
MEETQVEHAAPGWFVAPGEGDSLVVVVILLLVGALYGILYLYAAFDRWAEKQAHGTPLAKTIPTLLIIALLYEVFPLDHFHILLPLSAILIALMADWSRFHLSLGLGASKRNTAAGPLDEERNDSV